jgi:dimeric dUTPase (all-alpha-NTP-PPase superfamily)
VPFTERKGIKVNYSKLYTTQAKLDEYFEKHDQSERIKKKIFSLIIEHAEMANEKPEIFKFWSSNPQGNSAKTAARYAKAYNLPVIACEKDLVLEELVDMFHFMLSLGNELDISHRVIELRIVPIATYHEAIELHLDFIGFVIDLYYLWNSNIRFSEHIDTINEERLFHAYLKVLRAFFAIAHELGYTLHQLEEGYYEKNKVNHERQQSGY